MDKVYNIDCIEYMKTMKDNSVDLVVTDIPYGEVNRKSNGLRNIEKGKADIVTFSIDSLLDNLCRITKGSMYIFCGMGQVSIIRKLMVEHKMSTRLCIWEKSNPSPMNGDKIWLSGIECCVYGKFPKAAFNEHCKNTVFRFPCGRNKLHPTQKPLELMKYLIRTYTNEGDLVLDNTMGSGTTCLAAKEHNRKFIGIEKEVKYYE